MDSIKNQFLEEMVKNGRAYSHEIRSIANELLQYRNSTLNAPDAWRAVLIDDNDEKDKVAAIKDFAALERIDAYTFSVSFITMQGHGIHVYTFKRAKE